MSITSFGGVYLDIHPMLEGACASALMLTRDILDPPVVKAGPGAKITTEVIECLTSVSVTDASLDSSHTICTSTVAIGTR
jgi:hypothetical protein